MLRFFRALFMQFLFWMLLFAGARLLFLLFHFRLVVADEVTFLEFLSVFYHALKLDFSTSCYFMFIPFLALLLQSMSGWKFWDWVIRVYTAILSAIYLLITVGEIGLYHEWKTKLNFKALRYLQNPSEVYNSADSTIVVVLIFIFIVLLAITVWKFNRFFLVSLAGHRTRLWFAPIVLVAGLPVFVLGMRGGFQQIPINQSASYFSQKNLLNLAATNNIFNLYISVFENLKNLNSNPYTYFPQKKAEEIVSSLYAIEKDTTITILNTPTPNIVILLMESWTADLIESLGGEPGLTPQFKKLEKEGLLFDNVLSSGPRSEQAMAAIFSGFPAHAVSSITVQPDKYQGLPSMVKQFNEAGYNTSFYFGGQLIYGNIRSYIYFNEFDRVIEGKDFDAALPRGKLGVHDEFTFDRLFRDLDKEEEPFFSVLFTLSSHSPYDQPMEAVFDWGGNGKPYINSAFYSDRSLGEFFSKAQNTGWYHNTLFIVVADHSHFGYRNHPYHSPEYHRVPMLWLGGALRNKYKGQNWKKSASQADIPKTLLKQLSLVADAYTWSRDLFNPFSPDFKYFGFDNGLIWIEPNGGFSFDADLEHYYWKHPNPLPDTTIVTHGKAYLQTLFQAYLNQ
jgi:phosphoglycerol transferase MdoB-like AlkP superfamily enzyme